MRVHQKTAVAWACGSLLARAVRAADAAADASLEHLLEGLDTPPLNDGFAFYPDGNECPLPCADYANVFSWVRYWSPAQLHRCQKPMLLQFSLTQPLGVPGAADGAPLFACTLGETGTGGSLLRQLPPAMANPKRAPGSLNHQSLRTSPACSSAGSGASSSNNNNNNNNSSSFRNQTSPLAKLHVATGSSRRDGSSGDDVAMLLRGVQAFFAAADNCDDTIVLARHRQTTLGVYLGAHLVKASTAAGLAAPSSGLTARLQSAAAAGQPLVAQLCAADAESSGTTVGVALDATGDLSVVQQAVGAWHRGACVTALGSGTLTADGNGLEVLVEAVGGRRGNSTIKRSAEDAAGAGATLSPPSKNADGTCASYVIQKLDTCASLGKRFNITVAAIERFNRGKTWAWTDCPGMMFGFNMCLSEGAAALPPPQQGVECGPTVPGTAQPKNASVDMSGLNPCPLNACCSSWGFCGVFPEHCDIHLPPGVKPGAASTGAKDPAFRSTCVSNCGNEIKTNSGPPAGGGFMRIGYYEAFGLDRPCLRMPASEAAFVNGISYTHLHWAFADIDPAGLTPLINNTNKQWSAFKALGASTGVKRIASFGGWSFSTDATTFNIMRKAILENRDAFAANLATFARDEGLDGIDIDWEYPAAPDIFAGGQPIGQKDDGIGYLKFLTVLKQKLAADGRSLSISAPASFWYLKPFPIDRMAQAVDYIVFMTYDLHGQWDYDNANAFDSCPKGRCIRSHGE